MFKYIGEDANKRCVVVLSGGQDSSTCLFWSMRQFGRENVYAVGFDYGQKHKAELECAQDMCDALGISYKILDMQLLNQLAPNALTRDYIKVDEDKPQLGTPNTFVEGRNMLFLTFVGVYAKSIGARNIVTGVCETDFSGYPDCRDVFIKSLNTTLNLAMDYTFNIITPLMWLNKAETWLLAKKLGCIETIYNETLTCYNGIKGEGCGHCPACKLRAEGYKKYMEMEGK